MMKYVFLREYNMPEWRIFNSGWGVHVSVPVISEAILTFYTCQVKFVFEPLIVATYSQEAI